MATEQKAPQTAQQLTPAEKHAKKLQSENAQLKKHLGVIDPKNQGAPLTIAENSKWIGDHVVDIFGKAGSKDVHTLVTHRPIGSDYMVHPDSWVITDARDIPQLLASRNHPGAAKINSNITKKYDEIAIANELLTQAVGGVMCYPGDLGIRDESLAQASRMRSLFLSATGLPQDKVPIKDAFLPPAVLAAETLLKSTIATKAGFEVVKGFYIELSRHQPSTLAMNTQKSVGYLHGKAYAELTRAMYAHRFGGDPVPDVPDDWDIVEYVHLNIGENGPTKEVLSALSDALVEFEEATKHLNLAKTADKQEGKNRTRANKLEHAARIREAQSYVDEAKQKVREATPTWPKWMFQVVKIPIVTAKEVKAAPQAA